MGPASAWIDPRVRPPTQRPSRTAPLQRRAGRPTYRHHIFLWSLRWAASVAKVSARYPEARLIVPGHGQPGGRELLDNTLALIARQMGTHKAFQVDLP